VTLNNNNNNINIGIILLYNKYYTRGRAENPILLLGQETRVSWISTGWNGEWLKREREREREVTGDPAHRVTLYATDQRSPIVCWLRVHGIRHVKRVQKLAAVNRNERLKKCFG